MTDDKAMRVARAICARDAPLGILQNTADIIRRECDMGARDEAYEAMPIALQARIAELEIAERDTRTMLMLQGQQIGRMVERMNLLERKRGHREAENQN